MRRVRTLTVYLDLKSPYAYLALAPVRALAAELPADRVLVETDAPYLAPPPNRGKRNEPAFVADTAAVLAAVRGVSESQIADLTTENFFRLFAKVPR